MYNVKTIMHITAVLLLSSVVITGCTQQASSGIQAVDELETSVSTVSTNQQAVEQLLESNSEEVVASVPVGWPEHVPLPADYSVVTATTQPNSMGLVLQSDQPTDVLFSFYEGELDLLGWNQHSEYDTDSGLATIVASQQEQKLDITIVRDLAGGKEQSLLTISITE